MRTISTYNAYHLGDNLIHLHFLRALAQKYPEISFVHGADWQHLAQLEPLVSDLPNLVLVGLSTLNSHLSTAASAAEPLNAWRGAGGHWYSHPLRENFLAYHLDWFRHLAAQMGLESPITCAADLLFDYPALKDSDFYAHLRWDFLVVDAEPRSGQFHGWSRGGFENLIAQLRGAGKSVITSEQMRAEGQSITAIGKVSQISNCIIGCVTGPMWPCLNIWNSGLSPLASCPSPAATSPLRIHLLDTERVELTPNTVHANSLSLVPEILQSHGLL